MDKFMEYRTQRIQTLPLDLLNTTLLFNKQSIAGRRLLKKFMGKGKYVERPENPLVHMSY